MMKKDYVKPEILAEEFITEIFMLGGSNSQDVEEGEDNGRGANDRRGSWGNLWD